MFWKVLLLVLPGLVHGIHIDIQASTDNDQAIVEASGTDVTIISDSDRSHFKIEDRQLKQAVWLYNACNSTNDIWSVITCFPTDVYVNGPTPWNDLYTSYNWNEIRRTIRVTSARIIGISSAPVLVSENELNNYSSIKANFTENVMHNVQNRVSHTSTEETNFGFSMDVSIRGVTMSISYSKTRGTSHTETQTVRFGHSSGIQMELMPGQTVIASLRDDSGTMEIEVDYVAKLDGLVACNYNPQFKGHHFWGFDINAVLKSANLPQEIKGKEIIKVEFVENSHVIVKDKKSNEIVQIQPVDISS